MKALVQRVTSARVEVAGEICGSIGLGVLVYLGCEMGDQEEHARKLAARVAKLRLFADAAGKTNLALAEVHGAVLLVSEGQADMTVTGTGTEIRLANEGKAPYEKALKGKFSYVMMLFDSQLIHVLMTKAWADENGIKSWDDIAKKKPKMRLAINRIDNPQTTIGGPYEVMKAYGFTYDDIRKWGGSYVLGNSSFGLDAIVDGKADVFMNVRNLGDSLIKDIAGKRELRWIAADPEKMKTAAAAFDNTVAMVPKGAYPFMESDQPTINQWVAMLAGAHVSEETVYKYVKAIAEAEERVRKIGGNIRGFSVAGMVRNPANLPYHPGAARYYREKGLIK